jgi:hypothetical protein
MIDTSKLPESLRLSVQRYITLLPNMEPEIRRDTLDAMLMQAYHAGAVDACDEVLQRQASVPRQDGQPTS